MLADAIRSAGFGVVSLANNHIRDMGDGGVQDTLVACADAGLKTVGAGSNLAEATRPLIVGVGATRLAILAFAEHEFSIATGSSAGAWPLDPIDNHRQIREIRGQVDFVLVILHGGNEWYALPSPRMAKTCRFLVESGADAVVCHHGHVPSGVETYRGTPIVYGTGNFLFPSSGPKPEGWFHGYLVSLIMRDRSPTTVRLIPYEQCRRTAGVRFMEGAEASSFLAELSRLSAMISDEAALNAEWVSFCGSRRGDYLSMVLSLNRVESKLLYWGVWPFWRIRRRRLAGLRNLFSCEAHRDAAMAVLSAELEGGEGE
jgi:poly-gamma-glutamate synthesis protein (capsule biosynthesis protein)